MTDRAYEMDERRGFLADLARAEKGTLAERKEAAAAFYHALAHDPEIVAERIGWLLDGNYGYGAHVAAREVAKNARMNREAWLVLNIGALEWMSPQRMSIAAWKKLSPEQKAKLSKLVKAEIAEAARDASRARRRKT